MTIPELVKKARAARLLAHNAHARWRETCDSVKAAQHASDRARTDWDYACQLQTQAERELIEAAWADVESP